MKDVHHCLSFVHDPGTFHARTKKIVTPSDIRGLKVRPADATIGQLVSLLGGTNVQASAPEARDVLERGVADAITFPWQSMILFGIDKATKYHMDAPLYVTTFVWVMNKEKYQALSPAQKKVIDDHCTTAWAAKIATPWAEWEAAGRDKLKSEAGHEVYPISVEQLGEWRKAAEPVSKAWFDGVRKTGLDPDKVLGELKAELDQYKASY
jgi:TRAP-type transport system periplasmic protein